MHVKYGSQEAKFVLVVIQGDGPTLLGHNWLKYIKLDWNKIAVIHSTKPELWKVLSQKHDAFFQDDLGTVSSYQATLNLKPDATPSFSSLVQHHLQSRRQLDRNLIEWRSKESLNGLTTVNGQLLLCLCQRRMDTFAFVVTSKSSLTNV